MVKLYVLSRRTVVRMIISLSWAFEAGPGYTTSLWHMANASVTFPTLVGTKLNSLISFAAQSTVA